jgi:hypothetical protein
MKISPWKSSAYEGVRDINTFSAFIIPDEKIGYLKEEGLLSSVHRPWQNRALGGEHEKRSP